MENQPARQQFLRIQSQVEIREKLEYNHRLSRKGYAGLEAQLEETMSRVEIDRSTLWKKARQDKDGSLSVSGINDVLTLALGPEHLGRVRGVGAGISPRQYFNLPRQQRVKFADQLKESVRIVLQEETKKMEARSREETLRMEARTKQLAEAEREHLLSQVSQLIPNFDPSMLKPKTSPCQNQGLEQSTKNPMSDKASCTGDVRSLHFEDDTAKNGEKQEEMKSGDLENQDEEKKEEKKDEEKKEEKKDEEKKEEKEDEEKKEKKEDEEKGIEVVDYSKVEVPSSLQSLCRYVETTLKPQEKIMTFTIEKEVFGVDRSTFVLPEDITQLAGMEEIGAIVLAHKTSVVYLLRRLKLLTTSLVMYRHDKLMITSISISLRRVKLYNTSCLYDHLKEANMFNMVGFIDPAQVSANAGSLTDRSRLVASRLQKTDGEQIFMMPYNPGRLLEPFIDDLKSLWDGIRGVYDAHNGEYFTLRAALMWTINDFPAYGNLSSCVVKGYKACPICGNDTPSHRLKNGHKICYIGHRKWLPINHPYRRQRAAFNGKPEYGTPPEPLT
ncbi:unnamed protein product [Prunus armeniaca]